MEPFSRDVSTQRKTAPESESEFSAELLQTPIHIENDST
jgi:hypothetical protein